jgi:hypothetical protein
MNVQQLIKRLQKYPQNTRVVYYAQNAHLRHHAGYGHDVTDVETDGINVCIVGDFE